MAPTPELSPGTVTVISDLTLARANALLEEAVATLLSACRVARRYFVSPGPDTPRSATDVLNILEEAIAIVEGKR